MSNQWDFVVETLEDSDCDDLDIDLIFESKDILGALKLKFDKILIKNYCSEGFCPQHARKSIAGYRQIIVKTYYIFLFFNEQNW